ncbi:ABC transporter substrate-binding protein [Pedobacter aquatilis]|uniref:ABC transporter substrate-binding protein n=1 Tax=Pedobacter aquatilis TaxID=351343 RepID=UPI00292F8AFF|nr:ABC transporter substrate-binding protein [Pedobacter aquatilis]
MKIKITTIAFFLLSVTLLGCRPESKETANNNSAPLTVGYQNSPISTLLMVAKTNGYFDSTGVNVNLQSFTAGKFAVTALLAGKGLDLALSGELPIALAAMQGNKIRVITQVVSTSSNECRIVAINDGKANSIQSFFSTKRKIATSLKGTPEYFLEEFIKSNKLDRKKLEIVGMKPEDMTPALLSKSVDAICIFDPVASVATEKLGKTALVLKDSNIYSALYIVSALEKTINERKPELIKFTKGLNMAAAFCKQHPDSAKAIVGQYTKLPKTIVNTLWGNYAFDLALTDKLDRYLTEESKWINQDKTTTIPDYRKQVINTTVLKEVAPSKVTLK